MDAAENDIPQMAKVVERNVNALLHRKKEEIRKRTLTERMVDAVTAFAATMTSVYIHVGLFGSWVAWNLGWLGIKPFDPNFIILACRRSDLPDHVCIDRAKTDE